MGGGREGGGGKWEEGVKCVEHAEWKDAGGVACEME